MSYESNVSYVSKQLRQKNTHNMRNMKADSARCISRCPSSISIMQNQPVGSPGKIWHRCHSQPCPHQQWSKGKVSLSQLSTNPEGFQPCSKISKLEKNVFKFCSFISHPEGRLGILCYCKLWSVMSMKMNRAALRFGPLWWQSQIHHHIKLWCPRDSIL